VVSPEETSPLRILLIGLSGAGKSTLADAVSDRWRLPSFTIDGFRREHGDGTVAGDYFARAHFLRACSHVRQGIFEFSGSGIHRHAVRQAFREAPAPLLTVWLDVPHSRRRERLAARSGASLPWPGWKLGVSSEAIDDEALKVLAQDFATRFWEGEPGWHARRLDVDIPLEELTQSFTALVTDFAATLRLRGSA
jgi:thymidylate kinase